jgi:hypothetical protein
MPTPRHTAYCPAARRVFLATGAGCGQLSDTGRAIARGQALCFACDCRQHILRQIGNGSRRRISIAVAVFNTMAPKAAKAKEVSYTQEELESALNVKPPADPSAIDDHVHQLLMRAQVSWLSKRDVLDILTNWQIYNLPISLMPPDQPGRAFSRSFEADELRVQRWRPCTERAAVATVYGVWLRVQRVCSFLAPGTQEPGLAHKHAAIPQAGLA